MALTGAIAHEYRTFEPIVLWTRGDELTWPCGACLQILSEFLPADGLVLKRKGGRLHQRRIDKLLPEPFLADRLEETIPRRDR